MNWDLSYFYKNEKEFNDDFQRLEEKIPLLANYQGKLSEFKYFKEYFYLKKRSQNFFIAYICIAI